MAKTFHPDIVYKWRKVTKNGVRYYFHRKAGGNGEIIFVSQGYKTRSGRSRAIARIRKEHPKLIIRVK